MPIKNIDKLVGYTEEMIQHWDSRTKRMQQARDLFLGRDTLQERKAKEGMAWFISNEPMTLAMTVQALLTGNKPIHRVPLRPDDKEDARKQKATIEQFLVGLHNSLDECLRRRAHAELQVALADQMTLTGWYAALIRLKDPKGNGRWPFDIQVWDPINTFQEYGNDGLEAVVYSRRVTAWEITQFAPNYSPSNENIKLVQLHTYWGYDSERKVVNCIMVDEGYGETGKRTIKPLERVLYPNGDPMTEIPVFTGPVGGSPLTGYSSREGDQSYRDWQDMMGKDVYYANDHLYGQLNEQMALVWQHVRNTALAQYLTYSQSGDKVFDPNVDMVIPMRLQERIEPLQKSPLPGELQSLTNFTLGEIQRGGISHAFTGQIPFQLSGFAINQLLAAAQTIVRRFVASMIGVYKDADQHLLYEYQNGGFGILHVQGQYRRQFFEQDYMPDLLGKRYYVEVALEPSLPDDTPQRMQMAVMAKQSQLLALRTIHDEILKVQDPDGELGRMLEDDALQQPPVRLRRVINQLQQQGQGELAQILTMYLTAMERQIAAQVGGTGGAQALPQRSGMGPEVLPPEMGGQNPDMMAMMGQPQGQPNEVQQRLAAMGLVGAA